MTELLERLVADVGGRYMVERELGRGGMATVYLARDLVDETQVAIKVMDPELAAAVGAERFKREIGVASRLQHPNILGIIASGEAAGTSYYVMPFVKGETLRDRLDREKQLPIEDAIRIAREVADALDYAHKQGVVHRDIKPENILLDGARALVADFGIARAASEGDNKTLTKTGVALGTPHYMSPEQIFAEKDIDGRTDQYALACMLHEMLAGQPPFVGPHAQSLMAQHALDEPPLVSRFRPSTPPNVEDAILTGLAKTRADRFATLHDFRVALENSGYTSLMKVTRMQRTPTVPPMAALPKPVPAWKKALYAAGAVLVLAGVGGGVYAAVGRKGGGSLDPVRKAEMQRVAVLYFDADARGDLPALADGLTEGLITQLKSVKALTVRSRDAVTPFRGKAGSEDQIAAAATALDVGTLVTGEVEQQGTDLVVAVKLRDKSGATIERLATITQPVAQSYALRDKVAAIVAEALRSRLGKEIGDVDKRAGTANADAWTMFQRGERARRIADSLSSSENRDGAVTKLTEAEGDLRQAATLDPKWSAPLVSLANVALARLSRDAKASAPMIDSAEALADRAISLQRDDADAFAARGTARGERVLRELVPDAELDARFEQAAADLDTATIYDPTLARAYNMRGRLEYAMKRPDKAKVFSQRAYEADAFLAEAPNILNRLFITSHDLNQYDDAEKYCNEGARRFPANPSFIMCRLMVRMMPNADSVTPARIWRVVDSMKAAVPPAAWDAEVGPTATMFAAVGLIRAGQRDSAERVLTRAIPTNPRKQDPNGELMGLEAFVRAQLGQKEQAVALLERYIGEHPQHIVGFRRADFWWWSDLKSEKGFQDILALARAKK